MPLSNLVVAFCFTNKKAAGWVTLMYAGVGQFVSQDAFLAFFFLDMQHMYMFTHEIDPLELCVA